MENATERTPPSNRQITVMILTCLLLAFSLYWYVIGHESIDENFMAGYCTSENISESANAETLCAELRENIRTVDILSKVEVIALIVVILGIWQKQDWALRLLWIVFGFGLLWSFILSAQAYSSTISGFDVPGIIPLLHALFLIAGYFSWRGLGFE